MKVLLINGSPHAKGSTYTALHEMEKVFTENGIEAEIVHIGNKDIRGCVACGACSKLGKCAFSDMVNEVAPKFEEADGLVAEVRFIMHLQMQHLLLFLTVCSTAHTLTRP